MSLLTETIDRKVRERKEAEEAAQKATDNVSQMGREIESLKGLRDAAESFVKYGADFVIAASTPAEFETRWGLFTDHADEVEEAERMKREKPPVFDTVEAGAAL